MSDQNKSLYKKLIPIFGTKPLLPIIPCNAELTKYSKLDENNLGKIPGMFTRGGVNGLWSGFPGWSEMTAELVDIEEWYYWPEHSVGVQTKYFPAIDIDIDNPDLAHEVNKVIDKLIPPTTTRSRPNTPRTVRVFKLADGKEPIKKSRLIFDGGFGAVEFLGNGQHFVAEGLHPSGDYQSLDNTPIQEITPEQIQEVQEALKDHFGDVLEKGKPRISKTNSPRVRLEIGERSYQTMVDTIKHWREDSGRWDALRDLIWGWVKDSSATHAEINARFIMDTVENKDEKWERYYTDIPVLVSGAEKKINNQEYSLEKAMKALFKKEEELEPIDLNKLPDLLKKSAMNLSDVVKVDPIIHTTMLLTYMGISLGKEFKIHERDAHIILPTLSFIVGGVSGERKSGSINPMDRFILRKIKKIARDEHRTTISKAKSQNKLIKKKIDEAESELEESNEPIGSDAYNNMLDIIAELEKSCIEITKPPSIYMSDATSEAILNEQLDHGQVLIRTGEAKKLINIILGQYSKGGSDIGILLQILANDYVENNRVSSGSRDGGMGCGALFAMTQHENSMKLFSNSEFISDGFISRIFFINAQFRDKTEYLDDPYLDTALMEKLSSVMVNAFSAKNCNVELGQDAINMRREMFNKWEKMQHPGNIHWENREFVNKITSNAVRIATIIYFFEHYDKIESDITYFIDKKSMETGIYLAELFMSWNLSYIKNEGDKQFGQLIKKVLGYVYREKDNTDKFTPSRIWNFVNKEKKQEISNIIDELIIQGVFEQHEGHRKTYTVSLTVLGEQLCEKLGIK